MIGLYTESEYIQFLYDHYCNNDYEKNELYKWIQRDGMKRVSLEMKTLLPSHLSNMLKRPPNHIKRERKDKVCVYIMYEFDESNPYFSKCSTTSDAEKATANIVNIDLYCDTKTLIKVEMDNVKKENEIRRVHSLPEERR